MFESLFDKTFAILGSQLVITWGVTVLVIRMFRGMYERKEYGVTAMEKPNGELGLDLLSG